VALGEAYGWSGRSPLIMSRDRSNLVWIDLETTGLSVGRRAILEIASVVTDKDLNIVGEGPVLVIHQPDEVLGRIDSWCEQQHGFSGLLEASRASDISLREAEGRTLSFIRRHTHRGVAPLCGNSILLDRRFLMRYMPELDGHLSHRNIDVSALNELAIRWFPGVVAVLDKTIRHRAADDIRESIEELRLYRRLIFKE
jgi:oligoribonuclease